MVGWEVFAEIREPALSTKSRYRVGNTPRVERENGLRLWGNGGERYPAGTGDNDSLSTTGVQHTHGL